MPSARVGGLVARGMLAAGLLAAGGPVLAQPQPGIGIRLTDAPTARRDDPRARAYVVDHAAPGARLVRHVEVSNGTGRRARLLLYPAAADVAGGRFAVAPGRTANELSSWISVEPPAVDLAPGARATATVTIAVAPGAGPGERYAVVLAELPAGSGSGSGSGIAVASRVGVRVYLTVGGGNEPRTDFDIAALTAGRDAAGTPYVHARVRNTGQRAIDLSGELTLRNADRGFSFGPFAARLGTTLGPGQDAAVTLPLDPAIPAASYDARIVLRSGRVERAATARIAFPAVPGATASPVPAVPERSDRRLPVAVAVALLAVLAGALAALREGRRRARPGALGSGA